MREQLTNKIYLFSSKDGVSSHTDIAKVTKGLMGGQWQQRRLHRLTLELKIQKYVYSSYTLPEPSYKSKLKVHAL